MLHFLKKYRRGVTADVSGGALSPMPIIVGSPRSGTTLLRFILDAHPKLAIPPETNFLTLGPTLKGKGDKLRDAFFHAIINYPQPVPVWPDFQLSKEEFWEALTQIVPFTVSEGYRAFYRLYAARFQKPRWGDKTPLYCMEIGTIRHLLPEARFIHIIRDGRDAALSLRRMWFSPGPEIETQAAFWRKCILEARRAGASHPDYLEVRYEDLILNTRDVLHRICRHIDLSYDEAMLHYYTRTPERLSEHQGRSHADGTMWLTQEQRINQQLKTTEPPDPAYVLTWKEKMSTEERRAFQDVAGDLLEELGYEV